MRWTGRSTFGDAWSTGKAARWHRCRRSVTGEAYSPSGRARRALSAADRSSRRAWWISRNCRRPASGSSWRSTRDPAFSPPARRSRSSSSRRKIRPVAVMAVCRGVVVGQELVSPAVFQNEFEAGGPEVFVPVAETAEGVIRLTVYDYSAQPPTPVAERLVYRRPARRLSIQPTTPKTAYSPGDAVNLAVSVGDERGRPQSAVLGAAVVDEAALSLVRDRSASLTTHFWLMGQIDDVRGLEDANFYLSDGSEAEQALDLLLGTQGWRRFTTVPAEQLAQASAAGQAGRDAFAYQVPAQRRRRVRTDRAHGAGGQRGGGLPDRAQWFGFAADRLRTDGPASRPRVDRRQSDPGDHAGAAGRHAALAGHDGVASRRWELRPCAWSSAVCGW